MKIYQERRDGRGRAALVDKAIPLDDPIEGQNIGLTEERIMAFAGECEEQVKGSVWDERCGVGRR
jgi:hypothetical protein